MTSAMNAATARRLAGYIAHDLGGTLQALFNWVSLVEAQPDGGHLPRVREAAVRIREEIGRARELSQAHGPRVTLDAWTLVESALARLGPVATEVALDREPGAAPLPVQGSAAALVTAFASCLRAARAGAAEPPRLRVTLTPGDASVLVVVHEGEPPAGASTTRRRVEPLGEGGRVGLDLWLATLLVEEHGGSVWTTGSPGARRLELVLPAAPGAAT